MSLYINTTMWENCVVFQGLIKSKHPHPLISPEGSCTTIATRLCTAITTAIATNLSTGNLYNLYNLYKGLLDGSSLNYLTVLLLTTWLMTKKSDIWDERKGERPGWVQWWQWWVGNRGQIKLVNGEGCNALLFKHTSSLFRLIEVWLGLLVGTEGDWGSLIETVHGNFLS